MSLTPALTCIGMVPIAVYILWTLTVLLLHGVCVQVGAECVCASVLVCVGVVSMVGRFRDIKLTSDLNTRSGPNALGNNIFFRLYTYSTRYCKL